MQTMTVRSPWTALKLVAHDTPLSRNRFCSRCGASSPPGERDRQARGGSRVCPLCGLGLMLTTPLEASPARCLLVADVALRISAVSEAAEERLGVDEAEILGRPAIEIVVPLADPERFLALLRDTLGGARRATVVDCWVGDDHRALEQVRVGGCSPPPGVLLDLGARCERHRAAEPAR
jgi:PAS domain-containing protein